MPRASHGPPFHLELNGRPEKKEPGSSAKWLLNLRVGEEEGINARALEEKPSVTFSMPPSSAPGPSPRLGLCMCSLSFSPVEST